VLRPILDEYAKDIDAIEDGMNEKIGPSNRDANKRMIDFALETRRLVNENYGDEVKTVMLNPGPGAFPLHWISDFDPVFEASHKYGDYIGLHPYTVAIGDEWWVDPGRWEWYTGRFEQIDAYARDKKWYPLYVGTEAGPIGGEIEVKPDGTKIPHLNAGAGWRSPLCLSGNWQKHQQLMGLVARKIKAWNEQHGWRFRWIYLFTIFSWGWEEFQYFTEEFNSVADLALSIYKE
jgi:hypothetical protein